MKRALIIFLSCWTVFVVALLAVILCTGQAELHQMLTLGYLTHFSPTMVAAQDVFFKYATELGATVPFVVAAGLLFYKVGAALFVLLAQGATALLVYPIKVLVGAPRPSSFFAANLPDVALHQVDGVVLHAVNSFPSGHTAAAFSLMLSLTLICNKKPWTALLFFALAVIGGWSRIYLSQHFAEDVCAGAVVGVVGTLLVWWLLSRRDTCAWAQQSLPALLRRRQNKA
ncbi:MAG: phosphatase PAP2 family protein [Paludibacteraceae bacterium]